MKLGIAALAAVVALSGCTTTGDGAGSIVEGIKRIDAALKASAPATCRAVAIAHTAYVASELGSEKDKRIVEQAWNAITPICDDPSAVTANDLAVLAVQAVVIYKASRKQTNG